MNNGFRLTPIMINNLAEGYKSGKTTTQLAAEYKISKATICRALRKVGIEPERKDNFFQPKEFTPEEEESICIDYRAGLNIVELCKKYDTHYKIIVRLLEAKNLYKKKEAKKLNVLTAAKHIKVGEHKVKKFLSADEAAEICEKYQDGPQTKLELSEEYDVHVDTITAVLNKSNIATKNYLDDEVIEAVCEEFATGLVTISDLAKIYEKNPETLRYWLTKRGLIGTTEAAPPAPAIPTTALSAAKFRQLAREESEASLKTLMAIRDNPMESGRTRITAAAMIIDRAHGKPREEPEEDKGDNSTLTSKILKLVPKDLVKKKEEN